jgi:hypothetical protein
MVEVGDKKKKTTKLGRNRGIPKTQRVLALTNTYFKKVSLELIVSYSWILMNILLILKWKHLMK